MSKKVSHIIQSKQPLRRSTGSSLHLLIVFVSGFLELSFWLYCLANRITLWSEPLNVGFGKPLEASLMFPKHRLSVFNLLVGLIDGNWATIKISEDKLMRCFLV